MSFGCIARNLTSVSSRNQAALRVPKPPCGGRGTACGGRSGESSFNEAARYSRPMLHAALPQSLRASYLSEVALSTVKAPKAQPFQNGDSSHLAERHRPCGSWLRMTAMCKAQRSFFISEASYSFAAKSAYASLCYAPCSLETNSRRSNLRSLECEHSDSASLLYSYAAKSAYASLCYAPCSLETNSRRSNLRSLAHKRACSLVSLDYH